MSIVSEQLRHSPQRTGFEMIRMLASGECSAAALARSRTIEALVLNRSAPLVSCATSCCRLQCLPSRVMPGLRGTPAGMMTISESLRASARPVGVASWPVTFFFACQSIICR